MATSIDKLVAEIRLAAIEHEHKSLGARADLRKLHSLDPVAGKKKKGKKKHEAAALTAPSVVDSGAAAVATMEDGGVTKVEHDKALDEVSVSSSQALLVEYKNEFSLWKTKSAAPAYTLKRKFYRPKLQVAFENFNDSQRRLYRQKVRESIINLSTKLRKQFTDVQTDMNYTGVFHPAANAQRVQAAYLAKLYKMITAANIEDPAIEFICGEEDRRLQEIADDEARTNALLMKYSEGTGGAPAAADVAEEADNKEEEEDEAAEGEVVVETEEDEEEKKRSDNTTVKEDKKEEKPIAKERKKSESVLKRKASSADPPSAVGSPKGRGGDAANNSSFRQELSQSSVGSSVTTSNKKKQDERPYLDTLKVNRVKIGTSNPQDLLEAESQRLTEGSTLFPKRDKETSDLLNNETTEWMTKRMAEGLISKSGRGASLPETLKGPVLAGTMPHVGFEEFMALLDAHTQDVEGKVLSEAALTEKASLGDRNPGHPAAGLAVVTNPAEKPPIVNIVKQLSDKDEGFKAFLKVSQQRPAAKTITKQVSRLTANMSVRTRKLSPIGLEAVLGVTSTKNKHNLFLADLDESTDAQMGLGDGPIEGEVAGNTTASEPVVVGGVPTAAAGGQGQRFGGQIANNIPTPEISRHPSISGDFLDIEGVSHDESHDADLIYRAKLDEVWGIMRTLAMHKLNFMMKYCEADQAKSFPIVVERFGELALLTHGFMEVMKVWSMNKKGQVVFPVHKDKIRGYVESRHFPQLLASVDSLSSIARAFVLERLDLAFGPYGHECPDAVEFKELLRVVATEVSKRILNRIEALASEFEDGAAMGSSSLKDYIKTAMKATVDSVESKDKSAKK
jgi:hypothetical protein